MMCVRVLIVLGTLSAAAAAVGCGDDDDGSFASGRSGGDAAIGKPGAAQDAGPSAGGSSAPSANRPGRHSISGSVTASVAHGTIVTLSGAYDSVALPDLQGGYRFDDLMDGDYVLTPASFGYTFTPPSRAMRLKGADAEALDFAAIAERADCKTGFVLGPLAVSSGAFTDATSGDFDGDGNLDLVAIDGSAAVFLGEGDGSFGPRRGVALGDGARYATAGDVNGDGKLDLISVAQHAGNEPGGSSFVITLGVLLGHGDGTFDDPVEHTVGTSGDGSKPALGDFDDDGKLDAAVGVTGAKAAVVVLGDGDGGFGAPVEYATGEVSRWVTSGDFDGDGELDLASTQANPDAVAVLIGEGDGTFQDVIAYGVDRFPYSVVAGDWNGDGALDLATANNDGTSISVLINRGQGAFAESVTYKAAGMPSAIAAGDFNGDGKLDLVDSNGAVAGIGVFLGAGDGTFGPMTGTIAPATGLALGDFDNDGKLDVGVAGGGGAAVARNCR